MMASLLKQIGLGRMAHNTVMNVLWQMARVALQTFWLIAAARVLGVAGYGQLAGLAGLAATFGGFVGWGAGYLLLQDVSRDPAALGLHWRRAVLLVIATGLACCAFFVGVAHHYVDSGVGIGVLVTLGLAELICVPLINTASFAFQAKERLGWSGAVVTLLTGTRLIAISLLWTSSIIVAVSTYVYWHLGVSVLSALFALVSVHRVLKPNSATLHFTRRDLLTGTAYAAAWSTNTATTELDKTLVLHLSGAESSGTYSAAYRIASVLTLPAASLVLAAQPRLFRLGHQAQTTGSPLPRIAIACFSLGLAASCLLLALSYAIPIILGMQFDDAARFARMLAAFPPLYALRLVGGSVLMTSGRQWIRIAVEASGAMLLSFLVIYSIPAHGVSVMPVIVTATEAWLALASWLLVWKTRPRHTRTLLPQKR